MFKMKAFLSYRFTGEDPKELEETLTKLVGALKSNGHEIYCTFFDKELFENKGYTNKQIINHAFETIDKGDALFVFIKSSEKSEGMLMEIGYALANKKKIVLAIKEGVKTTFVKEVANQVIEFGDIDDLVKQLKELNKK